MEEPKKQNLMNPQSLNSYSYADGNPIIKSDPTGRCAGPFIEFAPVCIGAAYGVIETRANNSNATLGEYVVGAVAGGIQGALFEGKVIGAASIGFVSSIGQDIAAGQSINIPKAFVSAGANAVGAGTIKAAVSGVTRTVAQTGGKVVFTPSTQAVSSALSGGYQTITNVNAQRVFTPVKPQQLNGITPKSFSQSSNGRSNGGAGLIRQVVNVVKSLISNIFK